LLLRSLPKKDARAVTELEHIGKFTITGKLGQGSFGVVYRGYDPTIRRDVAIKVCSVEDAGLRKRFAREAQISGNLQHENIVTVYGADADERGVPYLVQELLGGEDLREVIRRHEPIPSATKIGYLLQVARGLAHAHAHGVIHRDVKPGNVRLLADGTVKIMDFGIAKLASAETQLTQKGVTMGTASYLPPEQVRGGDLDHRADVFSFGVLTYELLTYERPFRGNTLSALVYQILYKVPAPMIAVWPECPESLSDLAARCLEKKPEQRFSSMEELIPELERIVEEIEAGKWPALRGVSAIQPLETLIDETGVMSQTEIARTARVVELGGTGDGISGTRKPGLADTQVVLPPSPEETQAVEAPAAAAPEAAELVTRVLPTVPPPPPLPEAAPDGGADAPTVLLPRQELVRRAREIGALIEQGDLETAKTQLEETLSEHLEASGQARIREPAAGEPAAGEPAAGEPAAGEPAAGEPAAGEPAAGGPAAGGPETSSYTMTILMLPAWLRWAVAASLAALGLAAVGWLMLRPDSPAPPETAPPDRPAVSPTAAVPVALGAVTVAALPWAEIREITDADGFVKEMPLEPQTPLRLELPPGRYLIQLEHPDHGLGTCEVEVREDGVAPCRVELFRPEVTDYFKEGGWWP
jgi:serine/threonine-protein kinase